MVVGLMHRAVDISSLETILGLLSETDSDRDWSGIDLGRLVDRQAFTKSLFIIKASGSYLEGPQNSGEISKREQLLLVLALLEQLGAPIIFVHGAGQVIRRKLEDVERIARDYHLSVKEVDRLNYMNEEIRYVTPKATQFILDIARMLTISIGEELKSYLDEPNRVLKVPSSPFIGSLVDHFALQKDESGVMAYDNCHSKLPVQNKLPEDRVIRSAIEKIYSFHRRLGGGISVNTFLSNVHMPQGYLQFMQGESREGMPDLREVNGDADEVTASFAIDARDHFRFADGSRPTRIYTGFFTESGGVLDEDGRVMTLITPQYKLGNVVSGGMANKARTCKTIAQWLTTREILGLVAMATPLDFLNFMLKVNYDAHQYGGLGTTFSDPKKSRMYVVSTAGKWS